MLVHVLLQQMQIFSCFGFMKGCESFSIFWVKIKYYLLKSMKQLTLLLEPRYEPLCILSFTEMTPCSSPAPPTETIPPTMLYMIFPCIICLLIIWIFYLLIIPMVSSTFHFVLHVSGSARLRQQGWSLADNATTVPRYQLVSLKLRSLCEHPLTHRSEPFSVLFKWCCGVCRHSVFFFRCHLFWVTCYL